MDEIFKEVVKLNEISKLQTTDKNNIMGLDSILHTLMASKRDKVRKLHPYSITPPAKENGRWQTYYKGADKKRKLIQAYSEAELLDKLIPLYLSETHIDKLTFNGLFLEWIEYKKTVTESSNTMKRYIQHYNRYFGASVLQNKKIKVLDEILLETECNRIVKENNLPRKEWTNIKTILNGMFRYAIRKKYIEENLADKIVISVKFRQVVKKTGKTETYNSDELDDLNKYLDSMYAETEDTVYLAVKLNFLIGLRVGELVALRWSDWTDINHLHIMREEIRNQDTGNYEVVEHTKTNQDRFVILVPKALKILNKISHESDYIFVRNGQRITARQIAYVLEKYAERQGVPTKSTHKMRKTYASRLNANGVPLDAIREQLGHSSLSTTLGYIYNPLTEKETYKLIAKAL